MTRGSKGPHPTHIVTYGHLVFDLLAITIYNCGGELSNLKLPCLIFKFRNVIFMSNFSILLPVSYKIIIFKLYFVYLFKFFPQKSNYYPQNGNFSFSKFLKNSKNTKSLQNTYAVEKSVYNRMVSDLTLLVDKEA